MNPAVLLRGAVSCALACALAACGGGGGGGGSATPTLQSIAVTPARLVISSAASVQLKATGSYSDGSSADLSRSVAWTSGTPAVVDIATFGKATAVAPGTTVVTATLGAVSGNTDLSVAQDFRGTPTVWNFDDPQQPFAAATGPALLAYRDPNGTGWGPQLTSFTTASALGLPLVGGRDSGVMAFPATTPEQGYTLTHHTAANGVYADAGTVSNYTLVMDVLWPAASPTGYRSLWQTDEANSDDGDMFVHDEADGRLGIGVDGVYNAYGAFAPGTWHRIVIVTQCAINVGGSGHSNRYVDGLFVGGDNTSESGTATRCRWSLDPSFHLFTDNDGETSAGYIASLLYVDRVLFPDEIAALGGPNAAGANVPGAPPPPTPVVASRRVMIFAHRTHSESSPENTAIGVTQAFNIGADHVECDIRFTSDNHVVLMHDPDVDRNTTGTGPVADIDLATLQTFDAGSWWDPLYIGTHVPTLAQALTAAKGRGRLLLDVKLMGMGAGIEQSLNEAGVDASAIYPSLGTSNEAAADFQANIPGVGILWGAPPSTLDKAAFDDLRSRGVVGFDLPYTYVTKDFTDAAHANGMFVVAYTVLDVDRMLSLIDLGADGMETDYPTVLDSLMPPPLANKQAR